MRLDTYIVIELHCARELSLSSHHQIIKEKTGASVNFLTAWGLGEALKHSLLGGSRTWAGEGGLADCTRTHCAHSRLPEMTVAF